MAPWLPIIFGIHCMVFAWLYFRKRRLYHAALILAFGFLFASSIAETVALPGMPPAWMFKRMALASVGGSLVLRLPFFLSRD